MGMEGVNGSRESFLSKDMMLRRKLDDLLDREEWAQRSRQEWFQVGDRNTRYFHRMATIRSRKNRVVALRNEKGELVTDPICIEDMFLTFS